jgi:hypothetical protein
MNDLEIPGRALDAAREAYDGALDREVGDRITPGVDDEHAAIHAVRAAAPVIVATKLRQLADVFRRDATGFEVGMRVGMLECARSAREQAHELDPEGDKR